MKWSIERKIMTGVGVALALLLVNAVISYRATRTLINHERGVSHTHQVLAELEALLSTVKDAETGERGYIITENDIYLEPYQSAVNQINERIEKVRQLTADNPAQHARLPLLEQTIAARLAILKDGVELTKRKDKPEARQLVGSGRGKLLMDDLRSQVADMESAELDLLGTRRAEAEASGRYAYLTNTVANLIACGLMVLIFYVIMHDLTERKRTALALSRQREWLRVTLSSIGDAVIATDTEGLVTFLNPIAQSLTGWTQEEAEQQPLEKVFHIINEDTRQTVENPAMRAIREGIIIGLANHTVLIARDGREIAIDDSGAPIQDASGTTVGSVLIFRDITERREDERTRAALLAAERAARERAEEASRAKDEFVAMVSHEIRSPLNAILGWAQVLRSRRVDQAETDRAIETIERNARAQARLIEDLLDISRVITGKLVLNVRPVEPARIIEAAMESIRPAADARSIHMDVELEPGLLVTGDPNRLQQVIWNLLSNAVKFTPTHGHVSIKLRRAGSHLEIIVRDSGAGISPEFLPFVFDRFSQASTSTERKFGGLGLGLAIVRHLVELHGGSVRAESAGAGLGATFTVTLPVRAVSDAREADAAGAAESSDSLVDSISLAGLRVMIVDDEPGTRELLTAMLTARGAEVKACASAAAALEAIATWRPFVLVSDIGMPDEDGYALIRKLRKLQPQCGGNTPAIALTAYARSEDRLRALSAGFQMHVPKPVDATELIVVIASLAERTGKGSGA